MILDAALHRASDTPPSGLRCSKCAHVVRGDGSSSSPPPVMRCDGCGLRLTLRDFTTDQQRDIDRLLRARGLCASVPIRRPEAMSRSQLFFRWLDNASRERTQADADALLGTLRRLNADVDRALNILQEHKRLSFDDAEEHRTAKDRGAATRHILKPLRRAQRDLGAFTRRVPPLDRAAESVADAIACVERQFGTGPIANRKRRPPTRWIADAATRALRAAGVASSDAAYLLMLVGLRSRSADSV